MNQTTDQTQNVTFSVNERQLSVISFRCYTVQKIRFICTLQSIFCFHFALGTLCYALSTKKGKVKSWRLQSFVREISATSHFIFTCFKTIFSIEISRIELRALICRIAVLREVSEPSQSFTKNSWLFFGVYLFYIDFKTSNGTRCTVFLLRSFLVVVPFLISQYFYNWTVRHLSNL